MSAPYAVIFDMDGVLINSHGYVQESFDVVLAHHGLTLDAAGDWHGRSLPDILRTIKADHGIDLRVDDFAHIDRIQEEWMRADGLQPDPALVRLLDELAAAQIPVGVGTASPLPRAQRLLDVLGIRNRFSAIVTEEDIQRHKPHPDVFLMLAERLGVAAAQSIVIEDAVSGIEAAKRAGMAAVGFTGFHRPGYTLNDADLLIQSFEELSPSRLAELVSGPR